MDSSNEPSSLSLSTSKSRKRKADNSKNVIVPSKRARFLSTYRRDQEWSLPESIIHYMAMNPKKADVYEKLIESCKYFFVQNPIIVAERFAYVEYNDLEGIPFLYKDQENILLPTVLTNTVKELLENPHLSNLVYFEVCNLSELFDIETFMKFMKKTRDTLFDLHFCPPLSEAFKNRLDEMIDEILESKTCNMKLDFHGLDEEKRKKIESLYERF
uniref:Uncharacterized protein n=1 Tax=Panagrolaimus sp. ES5 TaxID=591445 RepID=A0AC34FVH5_9BILA